MHGPKIENQFTLPCFAILPLMHEQTTDTLLMVRPLHFGFNLETAPTNIFQKVDVRENSFIEKEALKEFDQMVKKIRASNIHLIVLQDTGETETPDNIFPNNWISFHNNELVIYPMLSANRRRERRREWIQLLRHEFNMDRIIDFSSGENAGQYLEGTGSLVLDRRNRVAYAALSSRTAQELLEKWSHELGYEVVTFLPTSRNGKEIYHTNVLLSIGEKTAVICLETIRNAREKQRVLTKLSKQHEIVQVSYEQMMNFAANILLVKNRNQQQYWIMSMAAFAVLDQNQKTTLRKDGELIYSDLKTIETVGGGSARCMIAEIFYQL